MKKTLGKLALPLLAASMTLGAVQAHAGAVATSVVEFTNFQIFHDTDGDFSNGFGAQVSTADLDDLTLSEFTNSANVSATLNGVASPTNGPGTGTPLDLYAEIGSVGGAYTDNDFTHLSSQAPFNLPGGNGNFAISDTNEVGAPITGLFDLVDSADVSTASYVSLEGNGTGDSDSNNAVTTGFDFTAQADGFLVFEFDLETFVEAFVGADNVAPTNAIASWSIVMTLEGANGTILDFGLSCAVSRNAPIFAGTPTNGAGSGDCILPALIGNGATDGNSFTDFRVSTTAALVRGQEYQFTARITTEADAEVVPEPATLAMFGLGLLAIFGLARRRAGSVNNLMA